MNHIDVGKFGEQLAQEYLLQNKYKILFCNYRFKNWEVDIIAKKKNTLYFVEVKTRKYKNFKQEKDLATLPEEAFTFKKRSSFINASKMFLLQNPIYDHSALQLCLIGIYLFGNHDPVINFYENILDV